MYSLDYLIYHVNPFGLAQPEDKIPVKLPLKEILRRSNEISSSPNYKEHKVIRDMEDSEIFKR